MYKFSKRPKKWLIHGNANPRILIAGHSHTFALLMAIKKGAKYSENFGLVAEANSKQFGTGIIRDLTYWNFVSKKSTAQPTVISWNGNQHNIHFLLEDGNPFQVTEIYKEFENSPVVPISQVRALFNPTFEELRSTLRLFNNPSNIYLLGTPPPKSKNFVDSILLNDPFFSRKAASLGIPKSDIQATSDALRIAMWKLTQQITEEVSAEFGCNFISIPVSTIDTNGLLKSEYWTEDLTHANEAFAEIILDEIIEVIGEVY